MRRTWLMESPFQITQLSRFSVTLFDTLLIFSPFSSLNLFIFPHLVRKKACTYLAGTFDIFIRRVLMCMRLWFSLVPTGTVDVYICDRDLDLAPWKRQHFSTLFHYCRNTYGHLIIHCSYCQLSHSSRAK